MARKNKNKKPTASRSPSGITIIKNVSVNADGVPVQIKTYKDKRGGHPHAIMDNVDDFHVSVGFTTRDKKGSNHPNYKMEKSPLNDGKQSYMRRQATVASKTEYEKPRQGSMTKKDYEYAKRVADRGKQKYISEKNKKNDKKK